MNTLADKTLRVIKSCKTLEQLEIAERFYWLALKTLHPLYIVHFSKAYDDKFNTIKGYKEVYETMGNKSVFS